MPCTCGSGTECVCVDRCHCSRNSCRCRYCNPVYHYEPRFRTLPDNNLSHFLDWCYHRPCPHSQNTSGSDKASIGRSVPQAAHNSQISRTADPESSQSTARNNLAYDSLMFPTDDIDSHPNKPEANSLKMTKSQGRDETSTPQGKPDSANRCVNIPKLAESQRITQFSKLKHETTNLKLIEAMESGLLTMNDPGSSYSGEHVSKQESSKSTDGVSFAKSPDVDEYDSLPSGNFSASEFSLSSKSPTYPPSTSECLHDLPQPTCKLKYSVPNALGTSGTSSASNLPNLETLKVSDSHQRNKSRSSSESNSSIEIVPDKISNRASSESDSSYEIIEIEAPVEKLDETAINLHGKK